MTHTEKVALAMAWYDSGLEDRAAFQTLMESLLAQPEQEPVATVQCVNGITIGYLEVMQPVGTKLFTTPPQRTWVGLTDDEIYSVLENLQVMYNRPPTTDSRIIFARAIEAAHGIKELNK